MAPLLASLSRSSAAPISPPSRPNLAPSRPNLILTGDDRRSWSRGSRQVASIHQGGDGRRTHHHRVSRAASTCVHKCMHGAARRRGEYLCPNACMEPPGRAATVPARMHALGRRGRAREYVPCCRVIADWRLRQVSHAHIVYGGAAPRYLLRRMHPAHTRMHQRCTRIVHARQVIARLVTMVSMCTIYLN